MDILHSTRNYEKWMADHTPVVKADLRYKHEQMRASVFAFLRGTFYRWVQLWDEHCSDLSRAPRVLGVGDLHVENFGTWRDSEGRLIWGLNDFDEACELPYTNDLVRLATSAHVAIKAEHLMIRRREACDLILEGYREMLQKGGRPFVLDEEHQFLRSIALAVLRDPVHFWGKMRKLPKFKGTISQDKRQALELFLPKPISPYGVVTRRAGFGSLGRVRLVAIGDWRGGLVAREIKAFLPSAWNLQKSLYSEIIARSVRVPDPFVRIFGNWIVRRLAPDCSRIELSTLPKKRDEARLLHAMGCETANIHLSSPQAIKRVQRDLDKRPASWLHDASKSMTKALIKDWKTFTEK
ncbi:MAG TPA: DUF2252 family protein [Terriglobia bacterium]|nr:DUF2252 family protein [Terriglobia bacterium]